TFLQEGLYRGRGGAGWNRADRAKLEISHSGALLCSLLQEGHQRVQVVIARRREEDGPEVVRRIAEGPEFAWEDLLVRQYVGAFFESEHRAVREQQLVNVEIED